MPDHDRARACVEEVAAGPGAWGLPWSVVCEFLAVVTRIAPEGGRATPTKVARESIANLIAAPACSVLAESGDQWPQLAKLLAAAGVSGPRIYDARIAAACLAHGVRELWTADRDYSRFPALRTRNPLVG